MRWRTGCVVLSILVTTLGSAGCSGRGAITRTAMRLDAGEAEVVYRESEAKVAANPKDSEALTIFARAAARLGRDDAALEALTRAEAMGGKHEERAAAARFDLWLRAVQPAFPALEIGSNVDAAERAAAHAALRRAARYDDARPGTAAIRMLLSDDDTSDAEQDAWVEDAVAGVKRVSEDLRWVVDALRLRANRLAAEGRHEAAVETMRRALDLAPANNEVLYDLGVHLHRYGEAGGGATSFREARDQFAVVTRNLPDDAEARYNLALCCYRLDDVACARAELDSLFQTRLEHASAHALAGRLALAVADTSRALGHITAARSLRGTSVPVPESALLVRSGPAAAKRYVLTGPPTSIRRYTERSGRDVEVWFDVPRGVVLAFSDRRQVAELELGTSEEDG